MSLEYYSTDQNFYEFEAKSKKKDRIFGIALGVLGLISIIFATYPLIAWYTFSDSLMGPSFENVPIPKGQVLSYEGVTQDIEVKEDENGFSYFATNYLPSAERPTEFTVSIPKLKIENAVAKTDSLDFYNNLSHFPGSALPGDEGNTFITGHSVLPQFYDPKNYRGIFSKLPELDVGDLIYVKIGDNNFRYVVQYKKVVNPKDLSVLLPIAKNSKNLTLMTCVPPGTSIKRLVVITSMI